MNTKKYIFLVMAFATIGSFALAVPVSALANQQGEDNNSEQGQSRAIVGTVSVISGSTITVVGKQDSEGTAARVTFTVNAVNASVTKKGVAITVSGIAVGDEVVVNGVVIGTNIIATTIRDWKSDQVDNDSERMMPAVVGKVSVINGNIFTVIGKQGPNKDNNTKTFTVDATDAKLLRGNTTITLSNIAINDNVVVQGTVTGTDVIATMIRDGKVGKGNENDNNQALLQIQGNGQPIIAGLISAINGSTLSVTNASVTYTVYAANAKIIQGKNTISISGVKIGDSVIVQGTIIATEVSASTIIDSNATTRPGFFASIGQWFRRLFGF